MKQFTIWENTMDKGPDWNRFHNADLPKMTEGELQGITPFELPSFPPDASSGITAYTHNFKPSAAGSTALTISSGRIASGTPTIGGTAIDDPTPPQLTVSATTFTYVYACINYTLSYSGSTVIGGTVTSRVISAETSIQTSTSTARYFLLFTWQAGRLISQTRFWSWDIDVSDDGTSTSTPRFRTWLS